MLSPQHLQKGKKHEQVCKSIARDLALSISRSLGPEIPVSDTSWAGREGSVQMHYGVLPTVGMRGYGIECAKRPRAFAGEGSAEAFDIGIDGHSERENCDSDIQCVSVSEETPVLGQSFLGERLLCGYGWAEQRNDPEIRAVPGERRTASGTTNVGARSSAFSEGAISMHPFGVQRAKPRSKNVVRLLVRVLVDELFWVAPELGATQMIRIDLLGCWSGFSFNGGSSFWLGRRRSLR